MKILDKGKMFFSLIFMSCFFSCETNNSKIKPFPKTTIEQHPVNTLTKQEIAVGWELLFDGKNTNQWRGYNRDSFPKNDWKIDQIGNLIAGRTDIITNRKFENFEIKLDYQLSEGENSGIYYRVIEAEAYPIWFNAPEYSLLDDSTYLHRTKKHPNVRKHMNGGVFDIIEPLSDLSFPLGKWNHVRIVLHSGFVEHWLNEKRVVEYQIDSDDWESKVKQSKFKTFLNYGKSKIGHVGIQGNESPVKFRNIKIREL